MLALISVPLLNSCTCSFSSSDIHCVPLMTFLCHGSSPSISSEDINLWCSGWEWLLISQTMFDNPTSHLKAQTFTFGIYFCTDENLLTEKDNSDNRALARMFMSLKVHDAIKLLLFLSAIAGKVDIWQVYSPEKKLSCFCLQQVFKMLQ